MFAILDTNHFSELLRGSVPGERLQGRITARGADVFSTIVTAQESFEGWFALINREKAGLAQIRAYAQFQMSLGLIAKFTLLPFDREAANIFHGLQAQRLRVGTMDLKIAAICLAHEATLLTRNLVDFEKVPGLRVENLLD